MAGFGRFKLTDALPQQPAQADDSSSQAGYGGTSPGGKGKGKGRGRGKSAAEKGKGPAAALAPDQVREARESSQAKKAEVSGRDRMVDIGRGNQQAGRQRAK